MLDTATGGQEGPPIPEGYHKLRIECSGTCVSDETVLENCRSALSRGLPMLAMQPPNASTAVIVGGAPSLKKHLGSVRKRSTRGQCIFTVNGAHDYLISKGIVPNICVLCDPMPELAGLFTPHKGVVYLVASQVDPSVFDKIAAAGCAIVLWHSYPGPFLQKYLESLPPQPWCIVYGGTTAALRSINVAHLMGFRKFRLFGVDSSWGKSRDDRVQHAYEHPFLCDSQRIEVLCAGRKFWTHVRFARQAEDFAKMFEFLIDCDIQAIGDGLIPWMSKILNQKKREIRIPALVESFPRSRIA